MSQKYKDEYQPIGQAIRQMLNLYHIDSKFDETNIATSWERLVGKTIAKRTRKVFIKNKVLYVEFDSPSMKHDLMLHKVQIMGLFEKEFGKEAINEIIVL